MVSMIFSLERFGRGLKQVAGHTMAQSASALRQKGDASGRDRRRSAAVTDCVPRHQQTDVLARRRSCRRHAIGLCHRHTQRAASVKTATGPRTGRGLGQLCYTQHRGPRMGRGLVAAGRRTATAPPSVSRGGDEPASENSHGPRG